MESGLADLARAFAAIRAFAPAWTARVTFPNQTIRAWIYEMPNGNLEQYQVAPIG